MGCIKIKLFVVFWNKWVDCCPSHTKSYLACFQKLTSVSSFHPFLHQLPACQRAFELFLCSSLSYQVHKEQPSPSPDHLQIPCSCAEPRLSALQVALAFFFFKDARSLLLPLSHLVWTFSWLICFLVLHNGLLRKNLKPTVTWRPVKVTIQLNGVFLSNSLCCLSKN